jgi:hypothetical protein
MLCGKDAIEHEWREIILLHNISDYFINLHTLANGTMMGDLFEPFNNF